MRSAPLIKIIGKYEHQSETERNNKQKNTEKGSMVNSLWS